jgi:hypothetical protein
LILRPWGSIGENCLVLSSIHRRGNLGGHQRATVDKAPGPDGFTGRFCHFAWSIIKWDISSLLMLSPLRIAEASTTLMALYSFSYPRLPTLYPWAIIALSASSIALGNSFPKHLQTVLLRFGPSLSPQTRVCLLKVTRFRIYCVLSSGEARLPSLGGLLLPSSSFAPFPSSSSSTSSLGRLGRLPW